MHQLYFAYFRVYVLSWVFHSSSSVQKVFCCQWRRISSPLVWKTKIWPCPEVVLFRCDLRFSRRRIELAVFWNVAPCSLVDTDRRFRGSYGLNHHPYGGSKLLKRRSVSTRVHGGTSQKTTIFVISIDRKLMCPVQFQPLFVFLDRPDGVF
jgi:hypothetical protein